MLGLESDEKYIVLIFENGLSLNEHMILEEILNEIGRNNNLSGFLSKLHFDEANTRLVNYNKASKQKEERVSVRCEQRTHQFPQFQRTPSPSAGKASTGPSQRNAGRLHEPGLHAGTHTDGNAPADWLIL